MDFKLMVVSQYASSMLPNADSSVGPCRGIAVGLTLWQDVVLPVKQILRQARYGRNHSSESLANVMRLYPSFS